MENNELHRTLEKLEKPQPRLPGHQRQLRLTYLNARRSAGLGILLILIPTAFIATSILKYILGFGMPFDVLEPVFSRLDHRYVARFPMAPVIFLGGLLTAIVVNLLAVLHLDFSQTASAVHIDVEMKKKPLNLAIIAVSVGVLAILFLYGFLENFQPR